MPVVSGRFCVLAAAVFAVTFLLLALPVYAQVNYPPSVSILNPLPPNPDTGARATVPDTGFVVKALVNDQNGKSDIDRALVSIWSRYYGRYTITNAPMTFMQGTESWQYDVPQSAIGNGPGTAYVYVRAYDKTGSYATTNRYVNVGGIGLVFDPVEQPVGLTLDSTWPLPIVLNNLETQNITARVQAFVEQTQVSLRAANDVEVLCYAGRDCGTVSLLAIPSRRSIVAGPADIYLKVTNTLGTVLYAEKRFPVEITSAAVPAQPEPLEMLTPSQSTKVDYGETLQILWRGGELSWEVGLFLSNAAGDLLYNIITMTENDGAHSWVVPSDVAARDYYIRVVRQRCVTDCFVDNGPYQINITAPTETPKPDLMIPEDPRPSVEYAIAGSQITLSGKVRNQGAVRADAGVKYYLDYGDDRQGSLALVGTTTRADVEFVGSAVSLPAEGTLNVSVFTSPLSAGNFRLILCVDPANLVVESNEINNCRAANFVATIGQPMRSVTTHINNTFAERKGGIVVSAVAGFPQQSCQSFATLCSFAFPQGTVATLTAVPSSGYVFGNWNGYSGCTTNPVCAVTLVNDVSITATFNAAPAGTPRVDLKAAVALTIGTINKWIDSPSDGPINLTTDQAALNSFYYLVLPWTSTNIPADTVCTVSGGGWSGNRSPNNSGGDVVAIPSVTTAYTIRCGAYSDSVLVVHPTVTSQYALTVTKQGTAAAGSVVSSALAGIDCGSDCSHSYPSGTNITLGTAIPANTTFAGWSGACSGTGLCTVTMNATKTVTATFNTTIGLEKFDVNSDGHINNLDTRVIATNITNRTYATRADLNSDGTVNVDDLALLRRAILNLGYSQADEAKIYLDLNIDGAINNNDVKIVADAVTAARSGVYTPMADIARWFLEYGVNGTVNVDDLNLIQTTISVASVDLQVGLAKDDRWIINPASRDVFEIDTSVPGSYYLVFKWTSSGADTCWPSWVQTTSGWDTSNSGGEGTPAPTQETTYSMRCGGVTDGVRVVPVGTQQKPNLIVEDIFLASGNLISGTEATFKATIKNNGLGAVPSGKIITVRFAYAGNLYEATLDVSNMAIGETRDVALRSPFVLTGIGLQITVAVDNLNIVDEADEIDNHKSKIFYLTPAPSSVSVDIYAATPNAYPSCIVTKTATSPHDTYTVPAGCQFSLRWTSSGATTCTASGAWTGKPALNNVGGILKNPGTYALECFDASGNKNSDSVTVSQAATSFAPSSVLTASALQSLQAQLDSLKRLLEQLQR